MKVGSTYKLDNEFLKCTRVRRSGLNTFQVCDEAGVIKLIFDCSENKVWRINKEGIAKDIKVPEVSGL